jgi:hypothetical protein
MQSSLPSLRPLPCPSVRGINRGLSPIIPFTLLFRMLGFAALTPSYAGLRQAPIKPVVGEEGAAA